MLPILLAIAPIFVLIILGHALRRGGIPSLDFWNLNDKLVYWVLFPALLFYKLATMDLQGQGLGTLAMAIYSGFAGALVFALIVGRIAGLEPPMHTSLMQGSARHNTFIALAVAETLFGSTGLATATLITALLIPVTNISIVSLMIVMLRSGQTGGLLTVIARDLMRNPLLLAVMLGWVVNASGVTHIPLLYDVCQLLGAAALPIVLLCVGANIRIRAMATAALPTVLSLAGKMIVFPLGIALAAMTLGLPAETTMVALVFGTVPTAAGAYTLARQMGGDAPAMAAIVTIQTGLSFITLPLTLLWVGRWMGVEMG